MSCTLTYLKYAALKSPNGTPFKHNGFLYDAILFQNLYITWLHPPNPCLRAVLLGLLEMLSPLVLSPKNITLNF